VPHRSCFSCGLPTTLRLIPPTLTSLLSLQNYTSRVIYHLFKMHLNTLLLGILATTTIAAADLKPRNYGAMLLPRQESLIACSELGLQSCVASTACCTAGVTCDGTGCYPIGETCTGVPTIHTLWIMQNFCQSLAPEFPPPPPPPRTSATY
jgi:hypothetical protein